MPLAEVVGEIQDSIPSIQRIECCTKMVESVENSLFVAASEQGRCAHGDGVALEIQTLEI